MAFGHGDRVQDTRTGHTGTVRVFDLSPEERAEGCAEAEVRWDNSFVSEELHIAEHNGLRPA